METSSAASQFVTVTFMEEMAWGGYLIRRYSTPKKYLKIVRRIRRLLHYYYEYRYRISYTTAVAAADPSAIEEIHGEIIEEDDIPSNRLLTAFIVDRVQSSTGDRYSNLKKRFETSEPETLSFFTKEEFDTFVKCDLKKNSQNGYIDDYIRYNFCEIWLEKKPSKLLYWWMHSL